MQGQQLRLFAKFEPLIDAAVRDYVIYLKLKIRAMEGSKMAAWILACADRKLKARADLFQEMEEDLKLREAATELKEKQKAERAEAAANYKPKRGRPRKLKT